MQTSTIVYSEAQHQDGYKNTRDGRPRMKEVPQNPELMFAPVAVEMTRRGDGAVVLSAGQALQEPARCVGEYLEQWAQLAADRPFLMERSADGVWQGLTYGEALDQVRQVASSLLQERLSAERPAVILSGNSVEHALLTLACLHVGIPVAPISPAYSLISRDFVKLRRIIETLNPGLVYVAEPERFAAALSAIEELHSARLISGAGKGNGESQGFESLLNAAPDLPAVARAFDSVSPDTIAKFLFTSGSTDEPKAVINTQRMLCSNQQAIRQLWPFLSTPPVLVDWLPWHHTFGGNHNFNLVLRNGGTLYIDAGRPVPQQFDQSLANLAEVSPTIFFNVPRAYDLLVKALRRDSALRVKFFSRLQLIFYAAASLPQHLWEALQELAQDTLGRSVPVVSSWGLTETAPAATSCYCQADRSGVVGLPIPGCELKLVPNEDKLEARVRGPNVTPGYWKKPELTAAFFDEEGFFKTGDAMRFVNANRPELGLRFDGRLGEDFKLTTGTWVSVGSLRLEAIATLAPIAQDIVITGHDRDEIGFLIFPNLDACRQLCSSRVIDGVATADLLRDSAIRERVERGLAELEAKGRGSSTYATRALFLLEPPSVDAGEITDKGYINQRAVLTRRAELVERLYRDTDGHDIVRLGPSRRGRSRQGTDAMKGA